MMVKQSLAVDIWISILRGCFFFDLALETKCLYQRRGRCCFELIADFIVSSKVIDLHKVLPILDPRLVVASFASDS